MNIYEPYTEAEKGESQLHLTQSFEDRLENTIVSRVLPLLALIFVFIKYVITDTSNTAWITGGIVFVTISAALILFTKIGIEIFFNNSSIDLVSRRIYGKKKETILLKDVDFIDFESYDEPRISGAFYRLVLKNNKRIILIRIPEFSKLEEGRFNLLNQNLASLTNLEIRHEWHGIQA